MIAAIVLLSALIMILVFMVWDFYSKWRATDIAYQQLVKILEAYEVLYENKCAQNPVSEKWN